MSDRVQQVHDLLEHVRQDEAVDVLRLCRHFQREIESQVSSIPKWWRDDATSQVCSDMVAEVMKKIFKERAQKPN
jgi:hypothetical protein